MKAVVVLAIAAAGCKDRGTIRIPYVEPCTTAATSVALYLKPATDCAALTCGLAGFDCTGGCTPLCADAYCTLDELEQGIGVDPPEAGDYALVMSFRYGSAAVDQGLACFHLKVDNDGTSSSTLAPMEAPTCCMSP